jgi:glucokinase
MTQKVPERVLAYDLGGTKVAVGVINSHGRILEEVRVPVAIQEGKVAVMRQLGELGKIFLKKHPKIQRVGLASAGPLDPKKGTLLDPTNFVNKDGKTWGKVPIGAILGRYLKRPVVLENDAAAAVLAEHWVGAGKGFENVMILTLGTGLGTGIITNGKLVRAGRGLHPEAGHIILNFKDTTAKCGCGNIGCAEAYLSGGGFGRRAALRFGNLNLTAKNVAGLARSGDSRALEMFDEYAQVLAVAIQNYVVLYSPEIIVLTGSFADAADLFLHKARKDLNVLLERRRVGVDLMPKITLSKLNNQAGLIGGAYVAFNPSRSN